MPQFLINRGARRKADAPLDNGFVDLGFRPDHIVKDGDVIEGESWALKAIHTPGHAPDHLCFEDQREPILFSGDHIMAWKHQCRNPTRGKNV